MKFVDEAVIRVIAGKGGNGAMSFLREKYRPNGGPDGGDGGNGGSIYLTADSGLNTLADFRFTRLYRAKDGESGSGRECFGKFGDDLVINVPLGTVVSDVETGEIIGEVLTENSQLLVARGGIKGIGNARFKSSVNQTPRQTTPGKMGDERQLKLELKVLADIGLLGLPNAGKSTFLSAVSSARPRIADYPFTTLYPQLGVVDVGEASGFVIADIPGLIEGAADGIGLGTAFLKHLNRTRILLHLVDIAPMDQKDVVDSIQEIFAELTRFDADLAARERWLVLNKVDIVDTEEVEAQLADVRERLDWKAPIYTISAATGENCKALTGALMERLDVLDEQEQDRLAEAKARAENEMIKQAQSNSEVAKNV